MKQKVFIEGIDTKEKALEHLRDNAPGLVKESGINEDSEDVEITTTAQRAGYLYPWGGDLFRSFEVW